MVKNKRKIKLSIAQKIALSFLSVIFVGSLLLSLPISQGANSQAQYMDHLFISVSMVCVTGLFTQPVVSTYSTFGQIVNILLMQIGGLGLMSIMAVFLYSIGRRISYNDKMAISKVINKDGLGDFKSYLKRLFKTTFIIEALGALLLSIRFIPQFGWGKGIFNSIFVAVSGFCNAGFDNFSTYSLLDYVHDPLVSLVVSSLLIFGGLGFAVWFDLFDQVKKVLTHQKSLKGMFKSIKLHTKVVLKMTLLLLFWGTVIPLIIEYNNPQTFGSFSFLEKVLASYFQSATMRTAGFATMDYTLYKSSSILVFVILMFVGGSPGGTAGGVKTTSIRLVTLFIKGEIMRTDHVNLGHFSISNNLIRKAVTVFIFYSLVLLGGTFLLCVIHPEHSMLLLLFEAISALATVGVSANLTPVLSRAAHIILMVLMIAGRIGPLTLYLSFSKPNQKKTQPQYAHADILVG